jgi:hypothetical protein
VPTRRAFLQTTGAAALAAAVNAEDLPAPRPTLPQAPPVPEWLAGVTRMTFGTPGEVEKAAAAGAQVLHTNAVWPYFPLKRDGGGLTKEEDANLRKLVADCRKHGLRMCLGLPPFPPVALVEKHPDWRVRPTPNTVLKPPKQDDLGTRLGCNLGPWGDYLIDVCAELVRDYGVDGYSFDGNYHPPICFCPACAKTYRAERGRDLPPKADLDDVVYREYLVWRGEKLEQHYLALSRRIKEANPDAVVFTWTVNAGRYGHFLHSPRAMPVRLNRLFDGAMQEWWLDETNLGASVAPAFGAAYLRAVTGGRPCAAEPYLMSRGNPYGTDSFPAHERRTRTLQALTYGNIAAESLGWPGHAASAARSLKEVERRSEWITRTTPLPWAALLVSEQTRQFYAYKDIAERFLPHVFGAFRACLEEHLPIALITDDDVTSGELKKYAVLLLPNAAALSDLQVQHVREFVAAGGGLVATGETSLCDELGRPRGDFALADVFGMRYAGRPKEPLKRPELDANFALTLDANYWKQRTGVARLSWGDHPLFRDAKLAELVPTRSVTFKGPLVKVTEPILKVEVAARMRPEGGDADIPAVVARRFERGHVAYLAAAADAALWSYPYPYQRRLLARALAWAARQPAPIVVKAPMCVQATYFTQPAQRRTVVHLFNGLNTGANHGLPAAEVPLREETVPVAGIEVRFTGPDRPTRFRCEPGGIAPKVREDGDATVAEVPPLELHTILIGEPA